jgi:hypothetical protein
MIMMIAPAKRKAAAKPVAEAPAQPAAAPRQPVAVQQTASST